MLSKFDRVNEGRARSVASNLQTAGLIPPQMPNSALLDSGSVEIPGFWEFLQSPVSTNEVIGLHEYFELIKETRTGFRRRLCLR